MNYSTLRNKIILYVLFSGLLTLLIFTVAMYLSERFRTIEDTNNTALMTVEKVGSELQSGFYKYAAYDEIVVFDEVVRQFARTQTNRDLNSVRENHYFYSTIELFSKLREISPEVIDVFFGLENTGNYVSVKHGVYPDPDYDCRRRAWYANASKATGFVPGTMQHDAGDSTVNVTGLLPMREEDGTLLGIAGVDISIDFALDLIRNVRFGKQGKAFLVMQDKQLLHFPFLSFKVGRFMETFNDDLENASGFDVLDTLIWQQEKGVFSVQIEDEEYQVYWATMDLLNWKLGLLVPTSEIMEPANDVLKQSAIYLIFGILLMLAASFYIAFPIVRPMRDLAERFQDLAGAEGDLTYELEVTSGDEIGQVSSGFNLFLDKIRSLVETTKSNTRKIEVSIRKLAATSKDMNENAETISNQTNEIATAAKQLAQSIDQITGNTREMEQAISSSEETISASSGDMEKFIAGADSLVSGVKSVSDSLAGLDQFSEKIENTILFIDDIADRVSLLALNASIEAAAAGEYGRGFQVVANEVKNLSTKIFDQTREIKYNLGSLVKVLNDVKGDLEALSSLASEEIGYSQKAKNAIVAMESAISDSSASIREISAQAQEQSNSTQLITSSIEEIASNNELFLNSISESTKGVDTINTMAQDLHSLIRRFKSK